MKRRTLVVIQIILIAALLSCVIVCMINFHHLTSIIDCTTGHGLSLAVPSRRTTLPSSSSCQAEYNRITAGQTPGLTGQDLRRSQSLIGNQYRLSRMMIALSVRRRPIIAVVAGGSISLGTQIAFIIFDAVEFGF